MKEESMKFHVSGNEKNRHYIVIKTGITDDRTEQVGVKIKWTEKNVKSRKYSLKS